MSSSVDGLYARAMDTLLRIQGAATVREGWQLPAYSEALLLQEMELFPDWYLEGLLGIALGRAATRPCCRSCSRAWLRARGSSRRSSCIATTIRATSCCCPTVRWA